MFTKSPISISSCRILNLDFIQKKLWENKVETLKKGSKKKKVDKSQNSESNVSFSDKNFESEKNDWAEDKTSFD